MQPDTDVCFDVTSLHPKSGFEVEPRTLDVVPLRNAPEHHFGNDMEVDGELHVVSAVTPDPNPQGACRSSPSSQLLWKIWQRSESSMERDFATICYSYSWHDAQYIVSNLLSDVDTGMTHWPNFWEQLDNLNVLLSNQSRLEKFRATCVNRSHPDAKVAEDMFRFKVVGLRVFFGWTCCNSFGMNICRVEMRAGFKQ